MECFISEHLKASLPLQLENLMPARLAEKYGGWDLQKVILLSDSEKSMKILSYILHIRQDLSRLANKRQMVVGKKKGRK